MRASPIGVLVIGSLNVDLVVRAPRQPRAGETLIGAKALLARGANMEATNKQNQSAWLRAAMGDQRDVIEVLRAHREAAGGKKCCDSYCGRERLDAW